MNESTISTLPENTFKTCVYTVAIKVAIPFWNQFASIITYHPTNKTMRLKSWESPRSGPRRNNKSKQASARVRQLKKQTQQLRKRLKSSDNGNPNPSGTNPGGLFLGAQRSYLKPISTAKFVGTAPSTGTTST
jgi:hypothetical protein